jgi:alkanesulfonate monooxygenase SsuD/methylene tetrahydromethanopterin reductase-like flavin-dependent oxidoreductase (luciferase family)/hemerythrin-like domain-containing protein
VGVSDYGHELEFGVFITPAVQAAEEIVALATLADRVELELVTFQDHPYQGRFLDTWTLLAFVAARTTRVRVSANVLNLPLRPPAVVARAVASLDILSGGRAELALGGGAFWEGIEAMGGRRLSPGQSVAALEEAIDVIRAIWDGEQSGKATYEGSYYRLNGAARGPAPLHDIGIWLGVYKPRMLSLTGRKADGWIPSVQYLEDGDLARGNQAIDEAAVAAGRDPFAIRRLLNVTAETGVEELIQYALEDGIGTFLVMADDAHTIERFASEIAPAVREQVAAVRAHGSGVRPAERDQPPTVTETPSAAESEYERLGVRPTPDDGTRIGTNAPWDELARPRRPASGPEVAYSRRGALVGQHLVDVHDMLRAELNELRQILAQVRDGAMSASNARSELNEMALRQNDWTLGAFCSRYCGALTQHHGLEDEAIFPHLAQSDRTLEPVIERLVDEHLVIHDAIQAVDRALVDHINHPDDYEPIQVAIDFLTDALLSHLSYEEHEIVEPLARYGFYPGQL